MFAHLLHHRFRAFDPEPMGKMAAPGKEGGADVHIRFHPVPTIRFRSARHHRAKGIGDCIDPLRLDAEHHPGGGSRVHRKDTPLVLLFAEAVPHCGQRPGHQGNFQLLHPVHPVTDQPPGVVFRLPHQIVKSVVEYRPHRTDPVLPGCAIRSAAQPAIAQIIKGYLLVRFDGLVQLVGKTEDILVAGLLHTVHPVLLFQHPGAVPSRHLGQFFHQLAGFLFGDAGGRPHRVGQNLQLRHIEGSVQQPVQIPRVVKFPLYIISRLPQRLQRQPYGSNITGVAASGQRLPHFGQREPVFFIAFLVQHFVQFQCQHALEVRLAHAIFPFFAVSYTITHPAPSCHTGYCL
nr:hypothetical protein [Subdoligranulum variabile]